MFSWKPIYMELAKALMAYRGRQGELLEWLAELKAEGVPVIKLDDEYPKDTSVPLAEIDPFSFFANFNRGIKEEYRRRILEFLKGKMGLKSPVPDDFDGLPVVHPQKALFFSYAYDRKADDVSKLWEFAQEVISKGPDALSDELFKRCLDVRQVGLAKLTMGMFWMRPDCYLAMDSLTLDYVSGKGVAPKSVNSLAEYRAFMSQIKSAVGGDYPAVSREAYLFANKLPVSAERIADGFRKLMEAQAGKNKMTVQDVALRLARTPEPGEKENEVLNRHRVFPKLCEVLRQEPLDIHVLKRLLADLWATKQGFDSARLGSFLKSSAAPQAIRDLLDVRGGIDEIARVDAFVDEATANGYAKPNGRPDAPGAAQFASVLLSAVYPERFVDFKDNRWNKLFTLVTEPGKRLCTGPSYGWRLVRAGKFAAALASSPFFQQCFGLEQGTWTAAGLAWIFKGGVFEMTGTSDVINVEKPTLVVKHPLNMILYGPPGTGKTYNTVNHAVAICDQKPVEGMSEDREAVAERFAQLQAEGRVEFVTFHQSMSYEDFVEGIKPDVTSNAGVAYSVKPGVFASICDRARDNWKICNVDGSGSRAATFKQVWNVFAKGFFEGDATPVTVKTTRAAFKVTDVDESTIRFEKQTGKSEHSLCVKTLERLYDNPEQIEQFSSGLRYYYKGLVEALQAIKVEEGGGSATLRNYVLIIDEINRGNVSSILGELITLLEDDKRLGNKGTELQVTLPYSKEPFGVPPNLYVVGTMNTADRSVEALDTALRRRFCFEEMTPCAELLSSDVDGVDLQRLFKALNGRLEALVDRDHMIGHAFFMRVADLDGLKQVFQHKVLPLLQEYFYGDCSKIHLVLGGGFIQGKRLDGAVTWPKGSERPDDMADRTSWTMVPPLDWTAEAFKRVYEDVEV